MTATPAEAPRTPAPDRRLIVPQIPPTALAAAPQLPEGAKAFLETAKDRSPQESRIGLITIDHNEGQFVLPSGEVVEAVSGFPVYYYQTRAFYAKPPSRGSKGQPPDCFSNDLVEPDMGSKARQAATCAACPKGRFGSGNDGRSQACSVRTWIFLLNSAFGSVPIACLVAPPSSIAALFGGRLKAGYFGQAASRHGAYQVVWTQFNLEPGGDRHCVLAPVMGAAATAEQARQIAQVHNEFLKVFQTMRGQSPEIEAEVE